jgi:hypothetical protein
LPPLLRAPTCADRCGVCVCARQCVNAGGPPRNGRPSEACYTHVTHTTVLSPAACRPSTRRAGPPSGAGLGPGSPAQRLRVCVCVLAVGGSAAAGSLRAVWEAAVSQLGGVRNPQTLRTDTHTHLRGGAGAGSRCGWGPWKVQGRAAGAATACGCRCRCRQGLHMHAHTHTRAHARVCHRCVCVCVGWLVGGAVDGLASDRHRHTPHLCRCAPCAQPE